MQNTTALQQVRQGSLQRRGWCIRAIWIPLHTFTHYRGMSIAAQWIVQGRQYNWHLSLIYFLALLSLHSLTHPANIFKVTSEEEREGAQNLYKWREAFFKDKFPYEVWVTTGGDDSHFGDTIPYQITRKVCHQLKQDNNDQWDQGSMQCLSPIAYFHKISTKGQWSNNLFSFSSTRWWHWQQPSWSSRLEHTSDMNRDLVGSQ